MSQSLECPRCHLQAHAARGGGWRGRRCPDCGAPLVLAPVPAEKIVRKYLYDNGLPPLRGRQEVPTN